MSHHHHEVSTKSVKYLFVSFFINLLLSVAEIIGGIISGSISLIGDALHNTSDALSILIAAVSFKIGAHKSSQKYTYGFKRAETIGSFVNLILLFISGCYLVFEGIERLIFPKPIDGWLIIILSVIALIIDTVTAGISHHDAKHSGNMRILFIHNLADALGSIAVIISGLCVIFFDIYRIDGIMALLIATYMIFQSVISFPEIVNILMNAAPENLDTAKLVSRLEKLPGVSKVHHLHVWCINEHDVSLECHIKAADLNLLPQIQQILRQDFNIRHSNIQIENLDDCPDCEL